MKMTNEQRTKWIQGQAIGDETPTGSQTGTILSGSKSLVYLGVTGKGLARPFRVYFGKNGRTEAFPYYVQFGIFNDELQKFLDTEVHWTEALHFLRVTNARHKVEKVLWGESHRDGWTYVKWVHYFPQSPASERYAIEGIMRGGLVFEELPAIPEAAE